LNSGGTSLIVDGTTDGGGTWTAETVSPTGTLTSPAISCQATATKGTCVVVTGKNAWVTVNSGSAWSASSLTGISSPVLDGVSCPTTSVCFATASGAGVVKLSGGTTYKASGEAWSTLSIGVTAESLAGISCASASVCTTGGLQVATYTTGSVNLGYQGAVLTTTNGGTSWTSSLTNGAPPTNLLANALLVDGPSFFSCPTSSACLAGGQEGVVSSQDDNVAPWTGAFLTPNLATATQLNCASLLACYLSPGSDVTYRSSGGGVGWNPENLPTTEKNGSSYSGPTNSVIDSSCNGTSLCAFLGKTTDGAYDEGWSSDGQTWAAQAESATSGATSALGCLTASTGYCIYFEKPSSSPAELEITGPCTLATCPSLGTLPNLETADGSSCVGSLDCWVVGQNTSGDGAVWATTNAGVTWTQQSLPSPLNGTTATFGQSSISC
jgi:hypothetical protein